MRLFIAVPLAEPIRRELDAAVASFRFRHDFVRWTRTEQLHATLLFMPDVPESEVDGVLSAMRSALAELEPGPLSLGRPGTFRRRQNGVLWVAIEKADWMIEAARRLAAHPVLAPLATDAGLRPFTPHLTVGRLRATHRSDDRATRALEAFEKLSLPTITQPASRIVLFESRLTPSGAEHSAIGSIPAR